MNFSERYPNKNKPNKYNSIRTKIDGRNFASGLEAQTYATLRLMEKAKVYSNIRCQKQIRLTPEFNFRVDFVVFDEKRKQDVYIEAKGFEVGRWLDTKRIWKAHGPGLLLVYKGSKHRVYLAETITPENCLETS